MLSFDDAIIMQDMNKKDKALATLADLIIETFTKSSTQELLPEHIQMLSHKTKHTDKGYSLLFSDYEYRDKPWVLTTNDTLSDYIESAFLVLNKVIIKAENIYKCKDVISALNEYYGSDILCIKGYVYDESFGDSFSCSEYLKGRWNDCLCYFNDEGSLTSCSDLSILDAAS